MVGVDHQFDGGADGRPHGAHVGHVGFQPQPDLHLDRGEALVHIAAGRGGQRGGQVGDAGEVEARGVDTYRRPAHPAQQRSDRLPQQFALDVPQREVDGAQPGNQHAAACIVQAAAVQLLPDRGGIERAATDHERGEEAHARGHHVGGTIAFAPAIGAVARGDFDQTDGAVGELPLGEVERRVQLLADHKRLDGDDGDGHNGRSWAEKEPAEFG